MAVLVVAFERFEVRGNAAFLSSHACSWRFAGQHAARRPPTKAILCFGDSLVKFGVLPLVLSEKTGCGAYNLAATVGPAPASYFLLRRALKAGAKPRAILVDFAAGIQKEGPQSGLFCYPWAELLTLREAVELASSGRHFEIFERVVLEMLLPSAKVRFEIRSHVRRALCGEPNPIAFERAASVAGWKANRGAAFGMRRSFKGPGLPTGPRLAGTWRCDPVNELYLDRFLALAMRQNVPVFWLIPPYSPTTQAHVEHQGDDALFSAFVAGKQARYPGLVVIDARHSGFRDADFFDPYHLDGQGAMAFSAGIADVLLARIRGTPASEPWVKLPDVASSSMALGGGQKGSTGAESRR